MLTPAMTKLLEQFASKAVTDIRKALRPYKATGATERSVRQAVQKNRLTIFGPYHLQWSETGRGPTRTKTPSEPTLYEAIVLWCKAKGIDKSAAYPITQIIHREGTLLFRENKTRDIYTQALSEQKINTLLGKLKGDLRITIESDFIGLWKSQLDIYKTT